MDQDYSLYYPYEAKISSQGSVCPPFCSYKHISDIKLGNALFIMPPTSLSYGSQTPYSPLRVDLKCAPKSGNLIVIEIMFDQLRVYVTPVFY